MHSRFSAGRRIGHLPNGVAGLFHSRSRPCHSLVHGWQPEGRPSETAVASLPTGGTDGESSRRVTDSRAGSGLSEQTHDLRYYAQTCPIGQSVGRWGGYHSVADVESVTAELLQREHLPESHCHLHPRATIPPRRARSLTETAEAVKVL